MALSEDPVALLAREVNRRFAKPSPLKVRQAEVLSALWEGKNVFASLPTGYGKSLCYWAPAAAWRWRVWVVSPLVSLIQDQSIACRDLGLRVACWHGGMDRASRLQLEAQMEAGDAEIVFLSPERLVRWWESGFVACLESLGVGPDLLALDEMHCFEDWRSFREGYREAFAPVRRLSERGVRILGLSASLSRSEARAWMQELCGSFHFVGTSLGRENLRLLVLPLEEEAERWLGLVSALRGLGGDESALVYCATRSESDETARWLSSAGFPACSYHAGLPPAWRAARSLAFRRGHLRIVCATTAFGMGVDYPKVRRVIHFSVPFGLEAYWQEAGRAGRDGETSYALAFWRRSEITRARLMGQEEKKRFAYLWFAWAEGGCRKRAVARQLGIEEEDCGSCDRCQKSWEERPIWLDLCRQWIKREPWWTQPEARPVEWAREKIFGFREKS
jgi:ATP-dependent DNA helicase RecQ